MFLKHGSSLQRLLMSLILLGWLSGCTPSPSSTTVRVILDRHVHRLEMAATPEARFQGLSDRAELAADGGMIFVFRSPEKLTFVMRRCLIPLDLVLLDGAGRIVDCHEMALEPYEKPEDELKRYGSAWPAQFALELPSGTIARYQLKKGQMVDLPLEELKRQAR